MIKTLRGAVLAVLFVLTGCATAEVPPPEDWHATELTDHALAGRIWRAADGRFVDAAALARDLAAADLVLLGETHDNPDHHRIQAWAVRTVFATGARPGLAIEMIREDQQAALEAYRAAHPGDAAGLGPALDWDASGWPAWRHYRSVVAPFVAAGTPIVAANLPTSAIRALARQGYAALGSDRRHALALDRPIPQDVEDAVAREMTAAHCGQLPPARALPFARIQIARDAVMAAALRAAAVEGKGVLVAGSGHVRADRGVALHLGRQSAAARILTLAPMEVVAGAVRPADYAQIYGAETLPFDYVWFTPRQKRADPCA